MRKRPIPLLALTLSLGWSCLVLQTEPLQAQAPGGMPPRQVGVIDVAVSDIPVVVPLPGRAVASDEAAVRPQVSGLITAIPYQAGRPLKAGDTMFVIDSAVYEAKKVSAEASVAVAQATAEQAAATLARARQLVNTGVSRVDLQNAEFAESQAQANVKAAQAALQIARAELDWATIRSPIDGIATVAAVSVGDLVTASQAQALATVTSLDPIEVDMLAPSTLMLEMVAQIRSGAITLNQPLRARLVLENGQIHDVEGELSAPGFRVSTSTGALDQRFVFANPDHVILPGMFLRGEVEVGHRKGILLPLNAATRDAAGQLGALLAVDGKALRQPLTEAGMKDGNWIVTNGLKAGDKVIVDGLMGLAPGATVVPVPVTLDAAGVAQPLAKN